MALMHRIGHLSWVSEGLLIYRFIVVGIFATILHMGSAWSLITLGGLTPLIANIGAFSLAFALSFAGQYLWTFRCNRRWPIALSRFVLVAACGFAVNNVLLLFLLDWNVVDDAFATVVAASVIPVVSYIGNRFWALS